MILGDDQRVCPQCDGHGHVPELTMTEMGMASLAASKRREQIISDISRAVDRALERWFQANLVAIIRAIQDEMPLPERWDDQDQT